MYIGIASFINLYKLSYFLERAFFFFFPQSLKIKCNPQGGLYWCNIMCRYVKWSLCFGCVSFDMA